MRFDRYSLIVCTILVTAACKGDGKTSANAQAVGDTIGGARRLVVIGRPTVPYTVSRTSDAGRITGSVSFTGVPVGDTTIIVPADQNGCGKPLTIQRLQRRNGRVAEALVWLTDARTGRPLPMDRRFEISNEDCTWGPTLQGVVAGGTINVVNSDPLADRAFITDVSTGDTVATAPFTDDGQLIPYDRLLKNPGVYEFSMESRPMSRAWVAVLDHPYFAVTANDGSFSIDGVPPGTYHIRVWHPLLGVSDALATVTANGTATADINFQPVTSPRP